jgi:hypothetical protein
MAETNINLGCAKINIKRDTHYYAPLEVINPRLLNPIPEDAKTYKLTPSTTLFFKHRCCQNLNFGWQQIKIKTKEKKNMYNQKARNNLNFWQKSAVLLTEANYDIGQFFKDDVNPRYRHYRPRVSTPGDKLTSFFLKQNKMDKEDRNTFAMNLQNAYDEVLIFLRNDGSKEAKKRADKLRASRRKSRSFFQKKNKKNRSQAPAPIVPSAPPHRQPAYNPDAGTIINNYTFNFSCGIM